MGTANEIRLYPEQFDDLFNGRTEWFILYSVSVDIEEDSVLVIRNRHDHNKVVKGFVAAVHRYDKFTEVKLTGISTMRKV